MKLYSAEDQAQLYEFADCLAVQTFLRMAQLPVQTKQRPNTEFISPTGTVLCRYRSQEFSLQEKCPFSRLEAYSSLVSPVLSISLGRRWEEYCRYILSIDRRKQVSPLISLRFRKQIWLHRLLWSIIFSGELRWEFTIVNIVKEGESIHCSVFLHRNWSYEYVLRCT